MNDRILRRWLGSVPISFAQLFLSNTIRSGIAFLIALTLIAPTAAGLAVLGSVVASWPFWFRGPVRRMVTRGLPGVNGALIGYSWILFPQVAPMWQISLTVIGAALSSAALVPILGFLRRKHPHLAPFSIPYLIIVYATIPCLILGGMYDRNFARGWHFYLTDRPMEAEKAFAEIAPMNRRITAYRESGIGWARFRQSDFDGAQRAFAMAIHELPHLADAQDGLGWAALSQNDSVTAERAFREALRIDPTMGDAWNGLGWIAYQRGDTMESLRAFRNAAIWCPFFPDTWDGLSRAMAFSGHSPTDRIDAIHAFLAARAGRSVWFINLRQLLAWGFLFLGICMFSRASALWVAVALGAGMLVRSVFSVAIVDIDFVYNLMAMVMALAGQYIILNRWSLIWVGGLTVGMSVIWPCFASGMADSGIPVLALPFNAAIVLTLVVFSSAKALRGLLVPLEIALEGPSKASSWWSRREAAEGCWKRIRHPENGPLI